MFRKSRKSAVTSSSNTSSVPQSPRFLQADTAQSCGDASCAAAAFSIGASQPTKQKSPGFFSRLFRRSKEEIKSVIASVNGSDQPRRKSLWQRSKSILRPRSVLDRSESAVLDLPSLNIRGSGSAAGLLMNEFPIEEFYAKGSAVDTDGLLMKIFEANHVMYEQLKEQERQKDAARMGVTVCVAAAVSVKTLSLEGFITPATTATELEVCEPITETVIEKVEPVTDATELVNDTINQSIIENTNASAVIVHHFADNPQLDSPLYRDISESFSVSSASVSDSESLSLESSIQSFNEGKFSLEGVDALSLTEIADMFDCLKVTEPETLKDGTLRCVYETESGSEESIRFHNWKQEITEKEAANRLRPTRSEEQLKLTEISVAPAENKLKQRSMSLAAFSKVESQVPVDRRRSLGAKVSQIVAMFEGGVF